MAIEKMHLKNFTTFEDIEVEFSPAVNVFIGENGTGKTHLLKVINSFCLFSSTTESGSPGTMNNYQFFDILTNNFLIDIARKLISFDEKTSNLRITESGQIFDFVISAISSDIEYTDASSDIKHPTPTIFIPAKEMLTHSKGLTSLNKEYHLPFDATQLDIITKAQHPNARTIPELAKNILPILESLLGGTVTVENDEFFIAKTDGNKTPFALEAEGMKKIGLLWKLLINKRITPNSILIWDEPEANINPAILPTITDILLTLARQGVQIFVSTHDYLFAKYFEVNATEEDNTRFHALYKNKDGTHVESSNNFRDLKNNPIIASYNDLLDKVIDQNLGD